MPMSLDFLNSIPRSFSNSSMMWHAYCSWPCVAVESSMSSMYTQSITLVNWCAYKVICSKRANSLANLVNKAGA
jgi:hypothetical protein